MDNSGLGSKRVIGAKHTSILNPMVSLVVVVSQGSLSEREQFALNGGFSEMQAARLEKCVVGLPITNPMGIHMPNEEQASKVLPSESQSPTFDSSNRATPLVKSVREWKRLAREKGSSTHEYNMGSGSSGEKGENMHGKCRMSLDLEEQMGNKKYCMDIGGLEDVQFSKMVVGV